MKYRNHPSILAIEEVSKETHDNPFFLFSEVDKEWLSKEKNLNLDICKTCQDTDVPTKIIKEKSYIYIHFLPSRVNASKISIGFKASKHNTSFYEGRKRMEKEKKNGEKEKYGPLSILHNISKVFGICIFRQIPYYISSFLSKYQCGFRKGYSTQNCLSSMLEKWKYAVDNEKVFGLLQKKII